MNTIKTKGAEERKGRKKQYLSFIDFCVMNEENGFYSVCGVWCGAVRWCGLRYCLHRAFSHGRRRDTFYGCVCVFFLLSFGFVLIKVTQSLIMRRANNNLHRADFNFFFALVGVVLSLGKGVSPRIYLDR